MITLVYSKELSAAIYTIEGDVDYSEIRDMVTKYYQGDLTKYTIGDYSKANPDKHLTSEQTKLLGFQMGALGKARPNGYDLIVVPGLLQYGIARMYSGYAQIISQDKNKLQTKVFRTKEDAVAFIRENEKPDKKQ